MSNLRKTLLLLLAPLLFSGAAAAAENLQAPILGLDEQIQEIKSDVLNIATELNLLEERLLYPSQTQVAVFVSLADGQTFRFDSIDLTLDDKDAAHHLYSFKELEALRKGGVQRLYTGQVTNGEHPLKVTIRGKSAGGSDIERSGAFTVRKGAGPGIVEIVVAEQAISFKDQ